MHTVRALEDTIGHLSQGGVGLGFGDGAHQIDITVQHRQGCAELVGSDHDELQFVAVQLAQDLVGLLQVGDHLFIVGADAVERDADEIDGHARAAAEDGLKIFLLHFEHGAFGGGPHGCGARRILDQRHLPNHVASASHTQDAFLLPLLRALGNDDLPVRDDIEHILVGTLVAEDVACGISAETREGGNLLQLLIGQSFKGQAQEINLIFDTSIVHHEPSINRSVPVEYNNSITIKEANDRKVRVQEKESDHERKVPKLCIKAVWQPKRFIWKIHRKWHG